MTNLQTGQSLSTIRQFRIDKIKKLREMRFDPYPSITNRSSDIKNLIENYNKLQEKEYNITGRVKASREHGKLGFMDLEDESGKIQIYLKSENLAFESNPSVGLGFKDIFRFVDTGDFLEISGTLVKTKSGQISIEAKKVLIITKSIRPLPDNWKGLQDVETRQRKRYLDLIMNPEIRERYRRRSIFWQETRNFLLSKGFLEINIPILEHTTGGAEANPFITHMDSIDQDFYLRISHELPLKRLIGGGYEKVFDIGARFRNEGFSDEHLPEHIAMEFYLAYADFNMGMQLITDMFRYVMQKVYGTLKFNIKGFEVDLSKDWELLDYFEILKKKFNVDIYKDSEEILLKVIKEKKIEFSGEPNRNRLVDTLWKDIRKTIAGPAYLINDPKFISPLSKSSPDNPDVTQRLQAVIAGSEMCNAFSELNDPIDQYKRFKEQENMRIHGDNEAMMMDMDFVEMLEYGMPPTFGFGWSERVFWFFENISAREGVPFPPMKEISNDTAKAKETMIAVAILNSNLKLERWQELNTIAHLSASFAARNGKKLLMQDEIETKDNLHLKLNIQHAIMIKKTNNEKELHDLLIRYIEDPLSSDKVSKIQVIPFTREMIETTDDRKVSEITKLKDFEKIELLGIMLFGRKSEIEVITKQFKLY